MPRQPWPKASRMSIRESTGLEKRYRDRREHPSDDPRCPDSLVAGKDIKHDGWRYPMLHAWQLYGDSEADSNLEKAEAAAAGRVKRVFYDQVLMIHKNTCMRMGHENVEEIKTTNEFYRAHVTNPASAAAIGKPFLLWLTGFLSQDHLSYFHFSIEVYTELADEHQDVLGMLNKYTDKYCMIQESRALYWNTVENPNHGTETRSHRNGHLSSRNLFASWHTGIFHHFGSFSVDKTDHSQLVGQRVWFVCARILFTRGENTLFYRAVVVAAVERRCNHWLDSCRGCARECFQSSGHYRVCECVVLANFQPHVPKGNVYHLPKNAVAKYIVKNKK